MRVLEDIVEYYHDFHLNSSVFLLKFAIKTLCHRRESDGHSHLYQAQYFK